MNKVQLSQHVHILCNNSTRIESFVNFGWSGNSWSLSDGRLFQVKRLVRYFGQNTPFIFIFIFLFFSPHAHSFPSPFSKYHGAILTLTAIMPNASTVERNPTERMIEGGELNTVITQIKCYVQFADLMQLAPSPDTAQVWISNNKAS